MSVSNQRASASLAVNVNAIGIAGALYRKTSLLIRDEGTSALDRKTDTELFEALKSLSWSSTTVLITHLNSLALTLDKCFQRLDGQIERVM